MSEIKSINWTYTRELDKFTCMEKTHPATDPQTEPSTHECECPEPCNCDHENE